MAEPVCPRVRRCAEDSKAAVPESGLSKLVKLSLTPVAVGVLATVVLRGLPTHDHLGVFSPMYVSSAETCVRVQPSRGNLGRRTGAKLLVTFGRAWVLCGCRRLPRDNATLLAPFSLESMSAPPGFALRSYARAILAQLPNNSLLLSHTDLTWNPVRYLQVRGFASVSYLALSSTVCRV